MKCTMDFPPSSLAPQAGGSSPRFLSEMRGLAAKTGLSSHKRQINVS